MTPSQAYTAYQKTPTPLTAQESRPADWFANVKDKPEIVRAEFAASLERENVALTNKVSSLVSSGAKLRDYLIDSAPDGFVIPDDVWEPFVEGLE